MTGNWVLEEKQDVKYFRLHFSEEKFRNLQCFFITRVGGLSFDAMKPEVFQQNVKWVQENFKIEQINLLRQIHSDEIFYLSENFQQNYNLKGDGLFTNRPNLYLGVRVADCLPIYLFAPERKIIGIVHSGRQGTLQMIALKMIKIIQEKFNVKPQEICYAFGPAIGQCCYNVTKEVIDQFKPIIRQYNIPQAVIARNEKFYLDLKTINQKILAELELRKIADMEICSFCQKDLFYSARRDKSTERNLAMIGYR